MQLGWVKIGQFRRKTHYNSKTIQDRCIVSIKDEALIKKDNTAFWNSWRSKFEVKSRLNVKLMVMLILSLSLRTLHLISKVHSPSMIL